MSRAYQMSNESEKRYDAVMEYLNTYYTKYVSTYPFTIYKDKDKHYIVGLDGKIEGPFT